MVRHQLLATAPTCDRAIRWSGAWIRICHQNGDEGHRRDSSCGAWRFHAQQEAGQRCRKMTPGLARPAHELQHHQGSSARAGPATRTGKPVAGRATSISTVVVTATPPSQYLPIRVNRLRAQQNEDEQTHDERGRQYEFVRAFALRPASIRKPNVSLFPSMMPNTKDCHEAAGLAVRRREIGADHGDQRQRPAHIPQGCPFLMADEKRPPGIRARGRRRCRSRIA